MKNEAPSPSLPTVTEKKNNMKLPCGCMADRDDPKGPVYWNEFNQVVQCHKCGHVYEALGEPRAELAATVPTQNELPIPEALYSCSICRAEYSWPAEDLFWSSKTKAWICRECYDEPEHGERVWSLDNEIKRRDARAASDGKEHDTPRQLPETLSSPSSANAQPMEGVADEILAKFKKWFGCSQFTLKEQQELKEIILSSLPSLIKEQTAKEEEGK